jgi:peptide/nickel transport system substrate-binding protein
MERLRLAWFEAPDMAAQQKVCAQMQVVAMRDVPFWPLGTVVGPTAYRSDISGVVEGFAAFWGVRRG